MPRPIMKALLRIACSLLLISASFDAAAADTIVRDLPPGLHVPADARPGPGFDIERATEAWLGLLSPEQRSLSDAYFEGGYWLKLGSLLYGLGVMAILLWTGLSWRMRDFAERASRGPWLAVAIYGGLFIVATFVLPAPPAAAGAEPPGEPAAQPDRGATGEAVEPAASDRRLHSAQRDLQDGRRREPQARPAISRAHRPDRLT